MSEITCRRGHTVPVGPETRYCNVCGVLLQLDGWRGVYPGMCIDPRDLQGPQLLSPQLLLLRMTEELSPGAKEILKPFSTEPFREAMNAPIRPQEGTAMADTDGTLTIPPTPLPPDRSLIFYVVLSATPAKGTWSELSYRTARSAHEAIRAALDGATETDGTYVAIPTRSWKPVTVKTEQTVTLKLEDASSPA